MAEELKTENLENIPVEQYNQLLNAYMTLKNEKEYNNVLNRLQFDMQVLEFEKLFPKNYIATVVKDIMKLLPMEVEEEAAEKPAKKKSKKAVEVPAE